MGATSEVARAGMIAASLTSGFLERLNPTAHSLKVSEKTQAITFKTPLVSAIAILRQLRRIACQHASFARHYIGHLALALAALAHLYPCQHWLRP